MRTPDIQIAFVAKETIPVLIAAVEPAIQPRKVILLHTRDAGFTARAQNLRKALIRHGIEVALEPVEDAFDPAAVRKALAPLCESLKHEAGLNLTCGTHVMTTTGMMLAVEHGMPAFYVRPDDTLVWLNNPGRFSDVALADRIDLESFLTARGFGIESRQDRLWTAYEGFLSYLHEHRRLLLPKLSRYVHTHKKALEKHRIPSSGDKALDGLLGRLPSVPVREKAQHLHKGQWLESYVTFVAQRFSRMDPRLQDVIGGLKLSGHSQHGKDWELDVLALYNNHLYVFETKALKQQPKDTDTLKKLTGFIYKLDALSDDVGGQTTQGVLISSVNPVQSGLIDFARAQQIHVLFIDQLLNLELYLRKLFK